MKLTKAKLFIGLGIIITLAVIFVFEGVYRGEAPAPAAVTAFSTPVAPEQTDPPEQEADSPAEEKPKWAQPTPPAEQVQAAGQIGASGGEAQQQPVSQKEVPSAKPLQTEAVVEAPEAVEPEQDGDGKAVLTCSLSVRCESVLERLDKLKREKASIIPPDGVMLAPTEAVFHQGESVFNLLQRELKRNKIHLEFVNTPLYHSAYIEGIGNLYEFDCGELSGWMYKVNGQTPNYGCSQYQLKDGDAVEWIYSCDMGRDANGYVGG